MMRNSPKMPDTRWAIGSLLVLQVGVMFAAISHESFWIDEFWNAYFVALGSLANLVEALRTPYGSQTPLHFIYGYLWGQLFPHSEFGLRLSNLPLFVMGQAAMVWALRAYPRSFAYSMLAVSALHPMVWQYANEFRPYTMMYAGSEMILAYLLHLHAASHDHTGVSRLALPVFAVGSVLLFGASLLGALWVLAACVYGAHFHRRHLGWRYLLRRANVIWVAVFGTAISALTLYYINSLLSGGGASRIATTTAATLAFDAYELLGLSGIGPGRLELRETGMPALRPYALWLVPACLLILATLGTGLRAAMVRLGTRPFMLALALGAMPVLIVVAAGFAMHWRVLGRHLMGELPLLNLLFALGLVQWFGGPADRRKPIRTTLAASLLLVFAGSSLAFRFAERHRKDDYQAASAIARQGLAAGQRVWWVADALGARYYALPGVFDYVGELTNRPLPYACVDRPGVQSISGAPAECLRRLQRPDLVIVSKPETFDRTGVVAAYLEAERFRIVQQFPAFSIWRPGEPDGVVAPQTRSTKSGN